MYDNTFLYICILCIVFVSLFFGHLHVMHDSISLHNCRNHDFLVIMEIILVSVNSVCIQGYRIYGLILQAFIQVNTFSRFWVLSSSSTGSIVLMGTEKKLLSSESIARLFC